MCPERESIRSGASALMSSKMFEGGILESAKRPRWRKQAAAAEIEIIHHFVEESTQSSAMMNGSQILQCALQNLAAVHHGAAWSVEWSLEMECEWFRVIAPHVPEHVWPAPRTPLQMVELLSKRCDPGKAASTVVKGKRVLNRTRHQHVGWRILPHTSFYCSSLAESCRIWWEGAAGLAWGWEWDLLRFSGGDDHGQGAQIQWREEPNQVSRRRACPSN